MVAIVTSAFSEMTLRWETYMMGLVNVRNRSFLSSFKVIPLAQRHWPLSPQQAGFCASPSVCAALSPHSPTGQSAPPVFGVRPPPPDGAWPSWFPLALKMERDQNLSGVLLIWKSCVIILMVRPRKEPSFRCSVLWLLQAVLRAVQRLKDKYVNHKIGLLIDYYSCVCALPFTRDLIFSSFALFSQPKGLSFDLLRFFLENESFGTQGLVFVEPSKSFLFASNRYMAKNFL